VPGPIHQLLADDHARLDELLRRATAMPGVIDSVAYEPFRAGLLRHIAMEEKVLFVEAKQRRDGEPLPLAKQLHADHAALAALLVPTPTPELLATIRDILDEHNVLEEQPGGLYEICDQLVGADAARVLARLHAVPAVRVSQHVDDSRVLASIARLLAARGAHRVGS
jgi:hypothetical protein